MKILYMSSNINAPDGSSVHGRAFIASVAKLGCDVRAYPEPKPPSEISPPQDPPGKGPGYYLKKISLKTVKHQLRKVHRYLAELIDLSKGFNLSTKELKDIGQIVESYRPDVIVCRLHVFHFTPFRIRRLYNIPCVLEVNSIRSIERIVLDKRKNVSFLTKTFEQYALDNADYIVCVSAVVKQHVDRYIDHRRSIVVPNGVDTERFDPLNFDRSRVKHDLGLENKTVLGYIGAYKAWHGLDTTIDVIGVLRKTKPHYHLLLIGTGRVYSQIQQKIDKMGLHDVVTQLAPVPHEEVPRYLAAFDYALMTYPALEEFYFSPLKMFEYLAMGIPVVATAIGQIREVITHRQTGLLVDPPTAENFANVVAAAESDPDGLDRIGKNARRLMVERYSWQANAAQVIAACERVLAARRQTC